MKEMSKEYIEELNKAIEAHRHNAAPQIIDNTFVMDLRIAERFGKTAIIDTFERVVKEWQNDVRYYVAFCYALSALCYYHYDKNNNDLANLYSDLYHKAVRLTEKFEWSELEQRYFYCVND